MNCEPIPLMKTGFSLCTFSHIEVLIEFCSHLLYSNKNSSRIFISSHLQTNTKFTCWKMTAEFFLNSPRILIGRLSMQMFLRFVDHSLMNNEKLCSTIKKNHKKWQKSLVYLFFVKFITFILDLNPKTTTAGKLMPP